MVEQTFDVVEIDSLPHAEVNRLDQESLRRPATLPFEPGPEGLIHECLEWPSGPSHFTLQSCRHIVVQGESSSCGHIMKSSI
jgi:hypothetical protein